MKKILKYVVEQLITPTLTAAGTQLASASGSSSTKRSPRRSEPI